MSFFTCVLSASANNQKEDKKAQQAEAQVLLDRAAKLTNIEAAGSQPFVYIANATWTENGKTTNALLGVAWQRVDRYREQIAFPGFMQTEVVSKDKLYRARNTDYLPVTAMYLQRMFKEWVFLQKWPQETLRVDSSELPKQLANAANSRCVADTKTYPRDTMRLTACFDDATGLPVLFQQRWAENLVTYMFSDYAAIGDNRFPREITYADSAGNRGEIKASRLSVFTTFADAEFEPVPDSKVEPWCAEPTYKNPLQNDSAYINAKTWSIAAIPGLDNHYLFVEVNPKGGVDKVFFAGFSPNSEEKLRADRAYGAQLSIKYCGNQAIPYEIFLLLPVR